MIRTGCRGVVCHSDGSHAGANFFQMLQMSIRLSHGSHSSQWSHTVARQSSRSHGSLKGVSRLGRATPSRPPATSVRHPSDCHATAVQPVRISCERMRAGCVGIIYHASAVRPHASAVLLPYNLGGSHQKTYKKRPQRPENHSLPDVSICSHQDGRQPEKTEAAGD